MLYTKSVLSDEYVQVLRISTAYITHTQQSIILVAELQSYRVTKTVTLVTVVTISVLPTHLQHSERSDQSPLPEAGIRG